MSARARITLFLVFAALAVIVNLGEALVLYPFSPIDIRNVKTLEPSVCPLSNVSVDANIEVENGWDLRELSIESTWQPVGKHNKTLPVSGGSVRIPNPGPELEKLSKSPFIRIGPEAPGAYRLTNEATTIGTYSEDSAFHGWPKIAILEYQASNTIMVLPQDDSKCKGEA